MSNTTEQLLDIPYEDDDNFPTQVIATKAVEDYCNENGLNCEFRGENPRGQLILEIDGVFHEVVKGLKKGKRGPGGYSIKCRKIG